MACRFFRTWIPSLALFVLLGSESVAFAQGATAEIQGALTDASGAVLPGVTVTGRNVQTGLERAAVTDKNGRYTLFALPPGTYSVSADLVGFESRTLDGVQLALNQQVTLDIRLEIASLAEKLTVRGEHPLVATTRAELGTIVDRKSIDSLPLNGRDFGQLAVLAPGVKGTPQDNTELGGARMNIGGQSESSNTFITDGVENNLDLAGWRLARYSPDTIREFQVVSNDYSAEFGRSTGGVINVLTRSGTNDLLGRASYFIRDDALDATPVFATRKIPFRRQQFGGFLGGPVVRNRTHFFGSVERTVEDRTALIVTPQLRTDYPKPLRTLLLFGKITHQLNQRHTLETFYNYAGEKIVSGVGGTILPSAAYDRRTPVHQAFVGLTSVLSNRTVNELRFTNLRARSFANPVSPGPYVIRPSYSEGRLTNMPQEVPENRFQVVESLTRLFNWGGEHSVKVGGEFLVVKGNAYFPALFYGMLIFATDRPFNAADLSTYPIQYVERRGEPYLDTGSKYFGTYVRDAWRVSNSVTLTLGLRYDIDFDRLLNFYPTDRNNIAPRASVVWAPFGDQRTVVRGGFGRYFRRIIYQESVALLLGSRTETIAVINPGYPDPFAPRPGSLAIPIPDRYVGDPDAVAPYADQASVGASRQIGTTMTISADYIRVRGHAFQRPIDLNAVDPRTGRKPQPAVGKINANRSTGENWYDALQASFYKRLSHGLQAQVSYTLSKTQDTTYAFGGGTTAPQSQFALDAEKGPSPYDERHRLAISTVTQLPWGVQLGGVLSAWSGKPYNITTGRDNNLDGYVTDRPSYGPNGTFVDPGQGFAVLGNVPRNAGRRSPFAALDLRASKVFEMRGSRLELLVEGFNVTNRVNYSDYQGTLASGLFQRPIAAYDPRQIQVGVKVDF